MENVPPQPTQHTEITKPLRQGNVLDQARLRPLLRLVQSTTFNYGCLKIFLAKSDGAMCIESC